MNVKTHQEDWLYLLLKLHADTARNESHKAQDSATTFTSND